MSIYWKYQKPGFYLLCEAGTNTLAYYYGQSSVVSGKKFEQSLPIYLNEGQRGNIKWASLGFALGVDLTTTTKKDQCLIFGSRKIIFAQFLVPEKFKFQLLKIINV